MIPRLVIAGTGSGVGKTTVTVGLIGALRARGMRVASFKCGPDYLDPSYHALASGEVCHNLDGWLMGREAVVASFERASHGADVAVIEGVMGLFDGASPTSDEGSTAQIAKWLGAPVVLVVDASGMARTIAAFTEGFRRFDRELVVAGLIANRVGGRGHLDLLHTANRDVLGGLPGQQEHAFAERHLGLYTASASDIDHLQAWGRAAAEWLDVDSLLKIAATAGPMQKAPSPKPHPARGETRKTQTCRLGLARDEAFHFYYEDNLARLRSLGARLVEFSPLHDATLPEVDGLYFGGGYPEAVAEKLAANQTMRDAVRAWANAGKVIYAECGGLMYLTQGIRLLDGHFAPMVGLMEGEAVMCDRLQSLGYTEVETRAQSILGPAGTRFRGHEFRYSRLQGGGGTLYSLHRRWGSEATLEGYSPYPKVVASYVHAHWASNPSVAEHLVWACTPQV